MRKKTKLTQYALLFMMCMVCCLISSVTARATEPDPRTTGLFVRDGVHMEWKDELQGEIPVLDDEDAQPFMEVDADLSSKTWRTFLYFEFIDEQGERTPVTKGSISVKYEGQDSPGEEVVCVSETATSGIIEFDFKKTGTYTFSCSEDSNATTVTVHVYLPIVGFYNTETVTDANFKGAFVENLEYERKKGNKTVYVIPNTRYDWKDITYDIRLNQTYDGDWSDYVKVGGSNDLTGLTGTSRIDITENAKCGFEMMAFGTIIYEGENGEDIIETEWNPESSIWCQDTGVVPENEDGEAYEGFSGTFISKKAYEENLRWDEGADFRYYVHADTMQGVIDGLKDAVDKEVEAWNGDIFTVEDTGYICLNVDYWPNYADNLNEVQTIEDTYGCKLAIKVDPTPYRVKSTDEEDPSWYNVERWFDGETSKYYAVRWEADDPGDPESDGKEYRYPVTGDEENGFTLEAWENRKTEDELIGETFEKDWEFAIQNELPSIYWKAEGEAKFFDNIFKGDAVIHVCNSKTSLMFFEWDGDMVASTSTVNAASFGASNIVEVHGTTLKYEVVPTGIRIKTAPTKTVYTAGEVFNKGGMVVELVYSDGSTKVITDYTTSSTALTERDSAVVVTYGTFTATQAIRVNAPVAPTTEAPTTEAPTTEAPTTEAPTTEAPTTETPTTEAPATPAPAPVAPANTTKVGDVATAEGGSFTVTGVADGARTVIFTGGEKNATKITVPATVTLGGVTYQVTAIADGAFSGNKKLSSVTIPDSIVSIGSGAFKGCAKLKKVTIPKNVKTIGKNAFSGCKKLKKITIKSTSIKKIGKNAFKGINKNVVIKVPKSKKKEYKKLLKKAGYKNPIK